MAAECTAVAPQRRAAAASGGTLARWPSMAEYQPTRPRRAALSSMSWATNRASPPSVTSSSALAARANATAYLVKLIIPHGPGRVPP
jgi:hypothetical protein